MKRPTYNPLDDRRGLAAALVPNVPPTHTVPTPQRTIPVNDVEAAEYLETGQFTFEAANLPILIAASRSTRGSIKLTNLSTVEIFWGKSNRVSITSGDLIPAGRGQWITVDSKSSIWAVVASIPSTGNPSIAFSEVFD